LLLIAGFVAVNSAQAAIPSQTVSVGGTVTGLLGSDFILQNNRTDLLVVESNGTFTFPQKYAIGQSYNVFVLGQPEAPAQLCTVANGSGVIKTNVTNITVTCTGGGPPTMSFTGSNPTNGATGVSRTVQAALNFSAPLAGSSINTSTITLRDALGTSVPETLGSSGSQFVVQGTSKLLPLTRYAVNVSTALRGTGGEVLDNPVTVGFTTRDGVWQSPAPIASTAVSMTNHQIAFDPFGNAIAVWVQQFGGTFELWANRFRPGIGWETPQRIGPFGVTASFPRISMDAAGDALVVWQQKSGSAPQNIWANRYIVNSGWGTAAQIETHAGAGNAQFPDVAAEPNGNGIAIWTVAVNGLTRTVASRFTTTGGWSTAQPIDNGVGNASSANIAMDTNGNATAIFNQSDGTHFNLSANRFTAGAWGAPVSLESSDGDSFVLNVEVDASGNAMAVWHQSNGASSFILANRFSIGTGTWGGAQTVGTALGNADPKMAVDASGNVGVVWYKLVNGKRFIFSNRFTLAGGWSTAAQLETHTGGDALLPTIAMDRSGNAIAVWQQEDDFIHDNAYAARFTPGGGWSTPQPLQINSGATSSGGLQVAIDSHGDAWALWSQQVAAATFTIDADRLE
jgi:hypothetical protein